MRQVVISIETTGLDVSAGHRIIEIGCVELVDEKKSGRRFHHYINPRRPVDQPSFERHGISEEFLADKPGFSEIADEFLDFINNDEIVTYNADHVLSYLHHEIALSSDILKKSALSNHIVDVLVIGNERHPNQNNSLSNLCERYYVDTSLSDKYSALLSALIIANLLQALIDEATRKITSDLRQYKFGENLVIARSFSDFDVAIEGISKTALCRGVSNHEYALLPSLFRHPIVGERQIQESAI